MKYRLVALASSFTVSAATVPAVRVGASFTAFTVIAIDSLVVFTPPLAVPPESVTE